jgi:hypothetical protein
MEPAKGSQIRGDNLHKGKDKEVEKCARSAAVLPASVDKR